jgi:RNAse (barnase) inhibitor barstar
MIAFSREPSEWQRLDWHLFQNGAIVLYFRPATLLEDIQWLQAHRYSVFEFRCEKWQSEQFVHEDFRRVLGFPGCYGSNFDALNDCLSDISIPEDGGVALVFHHFDAYSKAAGAKRTPVDRTHAEVILDIVADCSRFFLLTGQRFVALVQSDDPTIRFERLGCVDATWNPREWPNKNRGL